MADAHTALRACARILPRVLRRGWPTTFFHVGFIEKELGYESFTNPLNGDVSAVLATIFDLSRYLQDDMIRVQIGRAHV